MKINLGCGGHVAEGWVNIDRSLGSKGFPCHPEIVADARDLPFKDHVADAIFCGHLLEHIELDGARDALIEMRRVLKPEGRLCIVGPDYDRAVANFPEMMDAIWPGTMSPEWEGADHKWCATATNSLALVREVFPDAVEIPIAQVDDFWPAVAFLEWQFAIVAA